MIYGLSTPTVKHDMPDPARVATADEISTARARLGLTQTEFGRLFGVNYGAVSAWETGASSPKFPAAYMEEVVNRALGVRQDGHFVDPRSYALTVLATVEAEVQRHAADTLARIAEARRVLGLADVPSVPAATVEAEAARLKRPATGRRRRPAREG